MDIHERFFELLITCLTFWLGPFRPVKCAKCLSWLLKGNSILVRATWGEWMTECKECKW